MSLIKKLYSTVIKLGALTVVVASLTGCGTLSNTLPEWTGYQDPFTYGYKKHDPCIRCGEGWTFIPPSAHSN